MGSLTSAVVFLRESSSGVPVFFHPGASGVEVLVYCRSRRSVRLLRGRPRCLMAEVLSSVALILLVRPGMDLLVVHLNLLL